MTLEQEILIKEAKAREEGRAEWLEEGRAEWLEEGRAEGRREEKLEIAKNFKDNGVDLSVIVKSTGLSEEIVEKL